ncbi:MAG: diaminopimelate epimerase [Luteimonas sp.]
MSGTASPLHFTKMHGAGNDFVVLDLRGDVPPPDAALCRALADRHTGVGCDQILTVETSRVAGALARYRIWNADGSASQQCGNGARCVAAWLVRDGVGGDDFVLESPAGLHAVTREGSGYRIAMGVPEFMPARIPMAGVDASQPLYTLPVDGIGALAFGAASMGNPHAVIEVDDVDGAQVERIGRALQASSWFPESVNVGFAQVIADDGIRLRVFERGVGETLACGSGACAAVAVLARRGRTGRSVAVSLPGGTLHIDWPADNVTLSMAGPAAFVFEGEL